MLDPKRERPVTDSALPSLAKSRRANALPTQATSSTDKLDPKRAIPKVEQALDDLTKDRNDIELPTCTKSNTDIDRPRRANFRSAKELPS